MRRVCVFDVRLVAEWFLFCLYIAPTKAQDLYSLIPPPTDFYRTLNSNPMATYFGRRQIRYSMTVSLSSLPLTSIILACTRLKPAYFEQNHAQVRLWSVSDRTFWGPVWDPELEEYLLTGDHTDTTYKQEFELLDGGTYNNIPLNTRPRPSDFNDTAPQV